ncbi:hypothetical protein V8C86DRAFT_2940602 [Haematococcus lacustris]
MAASAAAADPRALVRRGMSKFSRNDVEGAAADFDAAWAADPSLRPFLWQRGLAHYYLGRYQEGAEQFRSDVAVNPNDTEEAIWAFICEARLQGPASARQNFLVVGQDSRPVMRAAYEAFKAGGSPDKIRTAIADPSGHSAFYGQLYVGLWHEAEGTLQEPSARAAILAACATEYARKSGDYMASLARVHCLRRGWQA